MDIQFGKPVSEKEVKRLLFPNKTKPETKEPSKGLLSSTKRMNVTDKMDKQEPKDRVQQYVGEIRKKRMELKNV